MGTLGTRWLVWNTVASEVVVASAAFGIGHVVQGADAVIATALLGPFSANVTGVDVAATALGAFLGGVVLGDVAGLARGSRKA